MKRQECVRGFWRHLRRGRRSKRTASAYARDAELFLSYVAAEWGGEISEEGVRAWLKQLVAEGRAPSTIARRLTGVRRLCRWLLERGELDADPTAEISVPEGSGEQSRRRVEVDREAVERVLLAPEPLPPLGIRDRAMMLLLADTGMELRELCALNLADLDPAQQKVTVGAGRRRRTVSAYSSWGAVQRYLAEVRGRGEAGALFVSRREERISERAVQHRVAHYAREAGVEVSVQDLIDAGRIKRTREPLRQSRRELGYARTDAIRQRYWQAREQGEPAEAESQAPTPEAAVEPVDGAPAGSVPMPSGAGGRPMTKADVWYRLEGEARRRVLDAGRAGGEWEQVAGQVWLEPVARLRAYARPVGVMMELLERAIGGGGGAGAERVDEAMGRLLGSETDLTWLRTDGGLLHAREVLLAFHSGVQMSSRLAETSWEADPGRLRAFAELVEDEELRETLLRAAKSGEQSNYVNPYEICVALHLLGDPRVMMDWVDEVLATAVGQGTIWSVVATHWQELWYARRCALEYYGIEGEAATLGEVNAALAAALIVGLVVCDPKAVRRAQVSPAVERPVLRYLLDTVHTVFYLLLRMLGHAPDAVPLEELDDSGQFVARFEAEWDLLLPYSDGFFGFAVVPRLSYEAMVRYHKLQYRPRGKLDTIPYEVGDYLVHQAKGSMHFLRPFLPTRLQDAFLDLVAPLYGPLLQAHARHMVAAHIKLGLVDAELPEDEHRRLHAGHLDMARQQLRACYDRYDFYQHPPGGPVARISGGVLGWRRRRDIQELADKLRLEGEQPRTPFAAYAKGYLDRRLSAHVRDLLKDTRAVGRTTPLEQLKTVTAPDGREYLTTFWVAGWCECSQYQLRSLDPILKPKRVREVFRGRRPPAPAHRLRLDARLYPATGELQQEVIDLLARWAGDNAPLAAQGLLTRTKVARVLEASVWTLKRLEDKGLVKVSKRGKYVVYDAEAFRTARQLVRYHRRRSGRRSS